MVVPKYYLVGMHSWPIQVLVVMILQINALQKLSKVIILACKCIQGNTKL